MPTGRIGDLVWYDSNQNGIRDEDEYGMGEMYVYLYLDDGDGVFEPEGDDILIAQTMTDPDWEGPNYGTYQFTNLPAGQYWVTVDPEVWQDTTPNPHPLIDLGDGESYQDADFGLFSDVG